MQLITKPSVAATARVNAIIIKIIFFFSVISFCFIV